jgi:ribonuclease P protein component
MEKFTFKKSERLSQEKLIQELFDKGSSFNLYPFRVLFLPHPERDYPYHQVLITVSNRTFKRAVDRNTIKRRIREAYRLNKSSLPMTGKWLIAYIYIAKEILDSEIIHKKLALTFGSLKQHEPETKS